MSQICITGTGYFGAARQRVKQLSKALNLQYSGELINGVTKVLVVADDLTRPPAELLAGQKVRTATSWGNVTVVSHQWLEDSAQRGVLCDPKHYTLLPQKETPVLCIGEESKSQTQKAGYVGDDIVHGSSTFADTPEMLRKAETLAQPAVLEDHFDLGIQKKPDWVDAMWGHHKVFVMPCEQDHKTNVRRAGSPMLANYCQMTPHMQHDSALKPGGGSAHTAVVSADNAQAHEPTEADISDLNEHPGSSALLPEPLQLLCSGDSSMCTPTADAVAGDCVYELSPQSVRITAERKQKRPPRHSTAASFHGVSAGSIAFYDTLTVEHPELDAPMEFSIHDPSHCALVHYEDSSDGVICSLAYAQLLHCYKLAKDDRIYIEHRYLYDAEDIRQQRAGSAFLEQHPMADLELVHSPEVYHSLAEVIDGEFWLVDRATAEKIAQAAAGSNASKAQLCLFCEHSWDRLTGSLLPL